MKMTEDGMPTSVQSTGTLQGTMDGVRVPANQLEMIKGVVVGQLGKYSYILQSVRPWREFVVLAKPPTGMDIVFRKVQHNVAYYRANYALIVSLFLLFSLLTSPSCLVLFAFLSAGWLYMVKLNEDPNYMLVVAGVPLGKSQRTIAGSIISLVLILIFAGSLIMSVLAISAVVVVAHAVVNGSEISAVEDVSEDDPINQI